MRRLLAGCDQWIGDCYRSEADVHSVDGATCCDHEVDSYPLPIELAAFTCLSMQKLADQLSVSVEDLIGTPARRTTCKRGPAPRMQQQFEQVSRLPRDKQRIVSVVIESLVAQSAR